MVALTGTGLSLPVRLRAVEYNRDYMANQTVLVTGSCGLIGSEVSVYFAHQGYQVFGIDSNHRAVFFGPEGDTSWVLERRRREIPGYRHEALDIRNREGVLALINELR